MARCRSRQRASFMRPSVRSVGRLLPLPPPRCLIAASQSLAHVNKVAQGDFQIGAALHERGFGRKQQIGGLFVTSFLHEPSRPRDADQSGVGKIGLRCVVNPHDR